MLKKVPPFISLCITGALILLSGNVLQMAPVPPFFADAAEPRTVSEILRIISLAVTVIVSLASGVLSDVYGRRKTIVAAAALAIIVPVFYLLFLSGGTGQILSWQYIFLNIFRTLPASILAPVALAVIAGAFTGYRGTRTGIYLFVSVLLATGLLFLLAVPREFMGNNEDFRWVYLAAGIAGILALIAAIKLPFAGPDFHEESLSPDEQKARIKHEVIAAMTGTAVLSAGLLLVLVFFTRRYMLDFIANDLLKEREFTTANAGLIISAASIGGSFPPLPGFLADRFGRLLLIAIGLALAGIAILISIMPLDYGIIAVFMGFFGLGVAVVNIATYVLATELTSPVTFGTLFGILFAMTKIGEYLGVAVGSVTENDASRLTIVVPALGFAFVLLGLFFFILKRRFPAGPTGQG